MIDSTCAAEREGLTERINAATPAAYGEENDVPSMIV
jgi:hypothetical protein